MGYHCVVQCISFFLIRLFYGGILSTTKLPSTDAHMVKMEGQNIVRTTNRGCLTVFLTDLHNQKSSWGLQGCKNCKRAFFQGHSGVQYFFTWLCSIFSHGGAICLHMAVQYVFTWMVVQYLCSDLLFFSHLPLWQIRQRLDI